MHCTVCKTGDTASGLTTVVLHRGDTAVIIKKVPADICSTCGEYYLSEAIASHVLRLAEDAAKRGAEVEVLRFAA
ncbi:MAG: type II toxin-antitoxin system MqsA family antitoxin [Proteobacteria bacterium]|nr:type II toxin-antitoxin system MqsA family antitoxin [Pseudomonadota bacterium]MBU1545309.1 type II toxin-antitoxin system MqsA family antitoxin [Pseudomonadota bacterium]MBU2619640.1 type II toxin-antitoxin system MqsA family antitoxin [Pseudomonadota bacterium]